MEIRILAVMIVIFGAVNLFRMTAFLIGSDIYSLIYSRKRKTPLPDLPSFSVIIPAHNEKNTVLRAIQSVLRNYYPLSKREVIVVDDGSADETPDIVEKFIRDNPDENICLVRQESLGKAAALNNGIKNFASGELVMCLDADSYLEPNALNRAGWYFSDPDVAALSANVKIIPRKGILNLVQQFEYLICYQMKRAESLFNCEYIVGGIGSVFRHNILKTVDYYDTNTVTEDIDITMKILNRGNIRHQAVYGADVVAHTEAVLSFGALIKQRHRWKWGRCQTFLKNIRLFFSPDPKFTKSLTWFYLPFAIYGDLAYLVEPLLLLYILILSLYYRDPSTLIGAWLVISFYAFMNVLAEDTIGWKRKLGLIRKLPFLYPLFFILSAAEYLALAKSLANLPNLGKSLNEGCDWKHVERPEISVSAAWS